MMSAVALARKLRAGQLDPVDLATEVLDAIEACDDQAIFTETTRSRAMAESKAARRRLRSGSPASLLDGVPIAWKDLFDLAGRVTTAGSVILKRDKPATHDAALVAAGKAGGLVTIGCLNMNEFAYSVIGYNPHYGTPRNPNGTGPARSPGGSSSGCGVVVAKGLLPLAIGTDTSGSVRVPAAFNGVVGYKSSTGRYPMEGVFPLSVTFDVLGPLAQTVADCVAVDTVLQRRARPRAHRAELSTLQIIVPETVVLDGVDAIVRDNFDAAIARLKRAGVRIRRVAMPQLREAVEIMARRGAIAAAEALALHWERLHGPHVAEMDPRVVQRTHVADRMTAVDLVVVTEARRRLISEANTVIGDALVAFPTTPNTAPLLEPLVHDMEAFFATNARTMRNTLLANFLDWCGLSMPTGHDAAAMPTAFLLSAPHGRDTQLLSAGLAIEEIVRG